MLSQSSSGLVEKLTLDDLVSRSDAIVVGKVASILSKQEANGNVVTLVSVSVQQLLKGESRKELVIRVPGGNLNGTSMEVEGAAKFQAGETAIVFLEGTNGTFNIIGGFQGKFNVSGDNYVDKVPYPEFIGQIMDVLAKQ
ncbi:MAG: hypothetical protein PHR43_03895 [Dehalococcoidales bacterium]|nr:hypothetical protein [Dehalococcoidales bacterium]